MQYVVKSGDTLWDIAQRYLGNGARWKELGFTGDPKKLPVGTVLNIGGGGAAAPVAPAPAPAPVDPMAEYKKMINDWYAQKPNMPAAFVYSPEQEAADTTAVQQEFRPFYQEQIDYSNEGFGKTLQNAREGYSRRGLWGAATAPGEAPTGGPVSGLRAVGETNIENERKKAETGFERAYTEAVAGGVQGRKAEAADVYKTTIYDPYLQQYKDWENRLQYMTALQKGV